MPRINIYHNPHFLSYRDRHRDIVLPTRPVATIAVPCGLSGTEALAYAYRQTQHVERPWWENTGVTLHVRSTSMGDVLEARTERSRSDERGSLFVVERMGFRPYQPPTTGPYHQLAAAYRLLDRVLSQGDSRHLATAAGRAQEAMAAVLEAEGYPDGDLPVLPWDAAQPGDLVRGPAGASTDSGLFRVIARRLQPKWRARRLLACVPNARSWIDSPRTWAVLVPVED